MGFILGKHMTFFFISRFRNACTGRVSADGWFGQL